ncbi:unnamed protein product [Bemisia tabaci]|uniref:Uncharacterized protein n=1 Tax=Bemisia tabaci TaxID=7038 RepID=A0A9P0A2J6_BEMTA|nr:unnamed protein product [Bemisia tabaci]
MTANFLGHSITVHKEYYRKPEEMFQRSQVSKLLIALERGIVAEFAGKSLSEINPSLHEATPLASVTPPDTLNSDIETDESDDEPGESSDSVGENEGAQEVAEESPNESPDYSPVSDDENFVSDEEEVSAPKRSKSPKRASYSQTM